jgi:hypothetical protein
MSTDLWGKRCYVRAETELLGKVGSVKFSGAPLCWSFGRSTALRGGLRRKEKFVSFPGTSVPGYSLWRPLRGLSTGLRLRPDLLLVAPLALDVI